MFAVLAKMKRLTAFNLNSWQAPLQADLFSI